MLEHGSSQTAPLLATYQPGRQVSLPYPPTVPCAAPTMLDLSAANVTAGTEMPDCNNRQPLTPAPPHAPPCSARYAPDLSAAEVKAGMEMLDANSDKLISLSEFVDWWVKKTA